ncbi:MAG: hypothetical protein ACI84O_001105 [Myxococcota bacterium]|jgi:hypothetical protein
MASTAEKKRQKAQRKKTIMLALLLLSACVVWSRTLFAGDASTAATPPTATAQVTAPYAKTAGSSVNSYATALQRLEVWPKALNRKVFVGSIEEITPINNLLNNVMEEAVIANESIRKSAREAAELFEVENVTDEEFANIDAVLSTTALLGDTAIAIINGKKYKIGDDLVLQLEEYSVRYEVSAIHSRRVVLRLGENEIELHIAKFKNDTKSLNNTTDDLPMQPDAG